MLSAALHLESIIKKKLALGVPIPKLFMTIGTEDFLLETNRDYYHFINEYKVPVTYSAKSGKHDWDFWNLTINDVIDWLPLTEEVHAINSGNIQ